MCAAHARALQNQSVTIAAAQRSRTEAWSSPRRRRFSEVLEERNVAVLPEVKQEANDGATLHDVLHLAGCPSLARKPPAMAVDEAAASVLALTDRLLAAAAMNERQRLAVLEELEVRNNVHMFPPPCPAEAPLTGSPPPAHRPPPHRPLRRTAHCGAPPTSTVVADAIALYPGFARAPTSNSNSHRVHTAARLYRSRCCRQLLRIRPFR